MFELSTLIITGAAGVIVGGGLGALLARSLQPQEQQTRELESAYNRPNKSSTNTKAKLAVTLLRPRNW